MAKKKYDEEYYSHLLINKTKRAAFIMVFSVVYFLMIFFIFRNLLNGDSWVYSTFPIMLVGIPIMVFPPVEVWVYKPWQSKAQKYERHYKD